MALNCLKFFRISLSNMKYLFSSWMWMVHIRPIVTISRPIKLHFMLFTTYAYTHTYSHTHARARIPALHASWCDPTCWLFFPPCWVCVLQFLSSLSSMESCLLSSCVCVIWVDRLSGLPLLRACWSDMLMLFWVMGVSKHHALERVMVGKLGLGRIPTRTTTHYVSLIYQTAPMINTIFWDISSVINLE